MKTYNFYDTCSLLLKENNLFENEENIVISSITLQELENIKTSSSKDADIKYKARKLLHLLNDNKNKYEIYIYSENMLGPILHKSLEINNDMKILACAIDYDTNVHPDETIFITNDLALQSIANLFFGDDSIKAVNEEDPDKYLGYKIVQLDDNQFNDLYTDKTQNYFDAYINEYVLLENSDGEIVDRLCWTGEEYRPIKVKPFNSDQLGRIRSMPGDEQQIILCDSLQNNQITLVRGPAGSGKTLLSLGCLFDKLEHHKIDKIIVFCNTVATKGSARLGFYPGTRDEKLLDSQIGNLLSSKLGGTIELERLIQDERLVLLPLSDIRGYDTTGMKAGIYISEAQNMDINLMKLALQRIGEDSICIIDGDDNTQVDDIQFAGSNNGMKRASKVFRGKPFYGEVKLSNIYRSEIAKTAEEM